MNSVHPGTVNSDLTRHSTLMTIFFTVFAMFLKTPREGAQTSIYCALAEELHSISGKHFRWVMPNSLGSKVSVVLCQKRNTWIYLCMNIVQVQQSFLVPFRFNLCFIVQG